MVFDLWFQTCQAHQSDCEHSQDLSVALRWFYLFIFPPKFPMNLSTSASHNPNPWMGFLSFRKPSVFCRNCGCFEHVCFLSSACIRFSKEAMACRGFQTTPLIWGLCPNPARAPFFASSTLAHLWPHPHSRFLPLILHHLAHTHVSEPDPTPVAAPTDGSGAIHSRFGW